jgi:hypothetical protein
MSLHDDDVDEDDNALNSYTRYFLATLNAFSAAES